MLYYQIISQKKNEHKLKDAIIFFKESFILNKKYENHKLITTKHLSQK